MQGSNKHPLPPRERPTAFVELRRGLRWLVLSSLWSFLTSFVDCCGKSMNKHLKEKWVNTEYLVKVSFKV